MMITMYVKRNSEDDHVGYSVAWRLPLAGTIGRADEHILNLVQFEMTP